MPEQHPVTDTLSARGQATLTDLPPEVLSLVCAEARRQDERWIQSSSKWDWSDEHLGRGARRTLDLSKAKGRHKLYEPGEWLGRSLLALSLVCRRTRAAARPFLCETIDEGHIAKPVFRIGALPGSLVNSVSHLSIGTGGAAEVINAIQAIPLLPSLSKFSLRLGGLYGDDALSPFHSDHIDADIIDALRARLASIPHLAFYDVWDAALPMVASFFTLALRHLELHSQGPYYDLFSGALSTDFGKNSGFFDYWPNLKSLALDSGALGGYVLDRLADTRTCLTSLRTLDIALWDLHAIPAIACVAPCMATLRLRLPYNTGPVKPNFGDPADVHFLHVERLELFGPRGLSSVVSCFSTSPLRHLSIALPSYDAPDTGAPTDFFHRDSKVPIPPALDSVFLYNITALPLLDFLAFRDRIEARNVLLRARPKELRPTAEDRAELLKAGHDELALKEARLCRIRETLQWALRRSEWLSALGDWKGLDELEWALERMGDVQDRVLALTRFAALLCRSTTLTTSLILISLSPFSLIYRASTAFERPARFTAVLLGSLQSVYQRQCSPKTPPCPTRPRRRQRPFLRTAAQLSRISRPPSSNRFPKRLIIRISGSRSVKNRTPLTSTRGKYYALPKLVEDSEALNTSKRPWLGRSLPALSLVNKACREAALLFLCKITQKHFKSAAFRLGKLPPSLLEGIAEVRLLEGPPDELVNIVLAMPQLCCLSKVSISLALLGLVGGGHAPQKVDEDAVKVLAAEFSSVCHVVILDFRSADAFDMVAKLLAPGWVHRLEIRDGKYRSRRGPPEDHFPKLRAAMLGLDSLVLVDENKAHPALSHALIDAMGKTRTILPNLRYFHVTLDTPGRVPLISRLAPALRVLRLEMNEIKSLINRPRADLVYFKHVEGLEIRGPRTTTPVLWLFAQSPLTDLCIELCSNPGKVFDENADLFHLETSADLPTSVQTLTLFGTRHIRRDEHAVFKQRVDDRGIAFESDATIVYRAHGSPTEVDVSAGADGIRARKDDVLQKARWASDRIKWLQCVGDEDGVRELRDALKRVKELSRASSTAERYAELATLILVDSLALPSHRATSPFFLQHRWAGRDGSNARR
ncbi:Proteophosphoglycan ppg4 [Rhodotorula toruloides ATCC 204091]|uniref:Proteophosphoglycan ppg4 n=1 Tax=Rhodotorula toruloides TaxID=5286 RepID=A0A2T0ADX0_RHOTO|nr:Proteophosphoglycan ppg4 [Rhodotorula toruloides ATCC 204091]PRQ76193.1 Proteophosphoglycan ppg4 [Rhodotorula toruloides]